MKKLLIVAAMGCLVASHSHAEVMGSWWSGFGQGTAEYGIKNDRAGSDKIYIACSDKSTTVRVTVGGKSPGPGTDVIFVIDSNEIILFTDPNEPWGEIRTNYHVGADNFIAWWSAMRRGTSMYVRLSTGESTVFTLKDSAKALPEEACTPDFYRMP